MANETDLEADDSLPLRELVRIAGGGCQDCGSAFSAKEAVWSIALGFKNAPRCLRCLCRRLGRDETELQSSLTEYVHRRECYLRAWREAETMDQNSPVPAPRNEHSESAVPTAMGARGADGPVSPDTEWNAGDLGCGELVMQLRLRLKSLPAGSVIRVTATDPAAPEDIPAWCRLTGHTLLTADHPVYSIRRKEG